MNPFAPRVVLLLIMLWQASETIKASAQERKSPILFRVSSSRLLVVMAHLIPYFDPASFSRVLCLVNAEYTKVAH